MALEVTQEKDNVSHVGWESGIRMVAELLNLSSCATATIDILSANSKITTEPTSVGMPC